MSDTPKVVRTDTQFQISEDGHTAFAEYAIAEGSIALPHTVVPEALGGRGLGGVLAEAALSYARAEGLLVRPYCTFMAGYIVKHPEWWDVVHPSFAARLGLQR